MLASANAVKNSHSNDELQVVLPEDLARFWQESGYEPSTAMEQRSAPRLRVRAEGKIEFTRMPPAFRQQGDVHASLSGIILVKNLSRSGLSILYHEQIFPNEEFCVNFAGRCIKAVAVRCRKLGSCCFETGGKILSMS